MPARRPSARPVSVRLLATLLVLPTALQAGTDPRIFVDGFETPVGACTHPLIGPPELETTPASWVDVWSSPDGSPQATYPNSVGFPVPVGTTKGKIRVVPFVPLPNQTVDITWDVVQSNQTQGYIARPALSMFISISPCAADLRPADPFATDPFARPGCRLGGSGGSMFFSTQPGTDENQVLCRLQAGQQYFMSISPVNPDDGITPGEHTCDDAAPTTQQGCDVQAVHRGY